MSNAITETALSFFFFFTCRVEDSSRSFISVVLSKNLKGSFQRFAFSFLAYSSAFLVSLMVYLRSLFCLYLLYIKIACSYLSHKLKRCMSRSVMSSTTSLHSVALSMAVHSSWAIYSAPGVPGMLHQFTCICPIQPL